MSNKPRETWNPRSAFARNKIRERDELTASIVNSRGVIEDHVEGVSKTRQVWTLSASTLDGTDAAEPEAQIDSATYKLFGVFAAKKYADDVMLRLTCQVKTEAGGTGVVRIVFTNSLGSYTAESSNITGTSYAELVLKIDLTAGDENADENIPVYLSGHNDGSKKLYIKWVTVEITSQDI